MEGINDLSLLSFSFTQNQPTAWKRKKTKTKKKHRVYFMTSERDIQVKRLNPTSVMNPDHRSLYMGFFRLMFMGFEIKTVNKKKRLRKSV